MIGLPLLMPVLLLAFLTPLYVPSDTLKEAATSTSEPVVARQRIVGSFVRRCRFDWDLKAEKLDGRRKLYSWENDEGLLARTEIDCSPGGECRVAAAALVPWPFPSTLGGKPIPTRIWGCNRRRFDSAITRRTRQALKWASP